MTGAVTFFYLCFWARGVRACLVPLCSGAEAGCFVLQRVQADCQTAELFLELLDVGADLFEAGCCFDEALVVGQCCVVDLLLQRFALALEGSWLLSDSIDGVREKPS